MTKRLTHRIEGGPREGECRECGLYDSYSAPDTCTRCALDRMCEAEYGTVADPAYQFRVRASEMWRHVAQEITSGRIQSGRFYLFVGIGDGGPLEVPLGEKNPNTWCTRTARQAQDLAEDLHERYPQVWVVTTVGCWNAVRTGDRG